MRHTERLITHELTEREGWVEEVMEKERGWMEGVRGENGWKE